MDNDIMELDYLRYLESVMEEQFSLEDHVNTCIGITESATIEQRLQIFTEAATERIKNNWDKFRAWIKRVFAKFLEKLANTFSNQAGYVEQYKDIILKKKVKEGFTVEIPNHKVGIERIFNDKIEALTVNDINAGADALLNIMKNDNNSDALNNPYEIFSGHSSAFASINKIYHNAEISADMRSDNAAVGAALKQYYLGGKARVIPTTDSSLNMTDMYEWCHDVNKIKANIEKDSKVFDDNCIAIVNVFETKARKSQEEIENSKQQPQQHTTQASDTVTNDLKNQSKEANSEADKIANSAGGNNS